MESLQHLQMHVPAETQLTTAVPSSGFRSCGLPHISLRRTPLIMSLFCRLSAACSASARVAKGDKSTAPAVHLLHLADLSAGPKRILQVPLCDLWGHTACKTCIALFFKRIAVKGWPCVAAGVVAGHHCRGEILRQEKVSAVFIVGRFTAS